MIAACTCDVVPWITLNCTWVTAGSIWGRPKLELPTSKLRHCDSLYASTHIPPP
jgi:hypothetical protein